MQVTDFYKTKIGRIALFVDGAFLLSMHPDVFAVSGLQVGDEVDEEALQQLVEEAELKEAKGKALQLLSYREYTARELQDRLEDKVSAEAAAQAVERMRELGYINDDDYAERYARELSERRLFGPVRVRQEMRRKGLSEEQIAWAISLLEENPQHKIRQLLEKKYPQAWSDEKVRRRAFAAILRMGYPPAEARRALREEDLFE